jgi:predicted alpha/beta superfamily hydrolase
MKAPRGVLGLGLTSFLIAGAGLALAGCAAGKQAAPAAARTPAPALTPAPSAAFASSTSTPAASAGEIIIGERVGLRSAVLGEERTLLVYRPPPERPDSRYPVLYLLDGEAHFHHVTGLVQFLMQQGLMPRVIVVGLSTVDRARDFTPARVPEVPTSGGADQFLAFLDRELIPAIDAAYPTADYRVLIGHSLGGLLAVHALNKAPDMFDAYISISPALGFASRATLRATEARLAKSPKLEEVLYLTIGAEGADLTDSNRAFAAMLRQRAPRGLRWMFEEMKWEDHGSIVHRGVHRGLELVFAGWRAPAAAGETLAGLERHYKGLAARFRIAAAPPEVTVNLLG